MTKDLWLNLPVKDVKKSREFFKRIACFEINEQHNNDDMLSVFAGENKVVVNFFREEVFAGFTSNNLPDGKNTEVLFSIGANSPEEVDELLAQAVAAGAKTYAGPGYKDGWMYGCGFVDLDGHRWNLLWMDLAKIPGK